MKRKTLITAFLAGLAGIAGLLSVQFAEAHGGHLYDRDHEREMYTTDWQHCYNQYHVRTDGRHGKVYSGICRATLNVHREPLYRYHQYRMCRIKKEGSGIFSVTIYKDCSRTYEERRRHPHYSPYRYRRPDHRYSPPYRDPDWYDRREHNRPYDDHRRDNNPRRDGNIPRGDDRRDERRDLLRKRRDGG